MSVYGQRVLWRQCATQSVSGAAAAAAASAVCGGGAWLACLGWRAVGRSRRWLVKNVGAAEPRKRPSSTLQSQNTATHTKVRGGEKKNPATDIYLHVVVEKAHAVREKTAASKASCRVAPHSRSSLWVGSSTANNQLHKRSGEVLYVVLLVAGRGCF